eukprot:jgi/Chrzof1/14046/Cz08g22140.t1
MITDFLSPNHCQALIKAAERNQLSEAQYNDAVLFDYQRLTPLCLVVLAGTTVDVLHCLASGTSTEGQLWTALKGFVCWTALTLGLAALVKTLVELHIKGQVFSGTKWSTTTIPLAAATARDAFMHQLSKVLDMPSTRFELPLITRYRRGEQQRVHVDARPPGDSQGVQEFLKCGGQRLVQCVVYLNTLSKGGGGGTAFHHPCLKGLIVQPQQGNALVFFPASKDGTMDARMTHSGLPVLAGEKWIINTWAMQHDRPKDP